MTIRQKFTCSVCQTDQPLRNLSDSSLDKAGTNQLARAVLALSPYDIVCKDCDEGEGAWEERKTYAGEDLSRNEVEAWSFSGLALGRTERDWLRLNF